MFFKRSYRKEMMDDFSINDKRIDEALKELKIINKYLGGAATTKKGLKKILERYSLSSVKILDVGGGASDVLLALNEKKLKIFSNDINKRITKYVKQNSPEIDVVCADTFNLPFKKKQIDIAHLSLFIHHFNEDEIRKILYSISLTTQYGIIINDLRRSVLAFTGIKILTSLFSKSEFVKNDGPLSVKKGFNKKEIIKILNELKFNYEINYKWAFRWLVIIYLKNEN
ncbi:MAG: methyltransferase domain-containing protein [Ignavibacteriales bacterium]|nr:MAG: methyltransferase domain-containing protein [Ignavibacteriales bacterium]